MSITSPSNVEECYSSYYSSFISIDTDPRVVSTYNQPCDAILNRSHPETLSFLWAMPNILGRSKIESGSSKTRLTFWKIVWVHKGPHWDTKLCRDHPVCPWAMWARQIVALGYCIFLKSSFSSRVISECVHGVALQHRRYAWSLPLIPSQPNAPQICSCI